MLTRKELKLNAKEQLRNNCGVSIAVIITLSLIGALIGYIFRGYQDVTSILTVESVVIAIVTSPLNLGVAILFLNIANKREAKYGDLFSGFNKILKVVGITILVDIIVFIGLILFIIPGIILSFRYSQVYYILAENPDIGIVECLKESGKIMKGRKWDYFVLSLSFILWYILMIFTFGIAGLYVIPYYQATITNFYLQIKE